MTEDQIATCLFGARLKLGAAAWGILRDSHAVEDLLQDLFVKALARTNQFEDEDHLLRWARVSCQNAAIDLYRKQTNRSKLLEEESLRMVNETWDARPDEHLDNALYALRFCLGRLPKKTRQMMADRYHKEESVQTIAGKMGRSLTAVYQILSRTQRQLRECMKGRMKEEGDLT